MRPAVCRVPKTHGKGLFAHGKAFAVCCTRHTAHGKQESAKRSFAVCHLLGTRKIVCRVLKNTRQRSFEKTDFKNRKQKIFNSGRTPPASHTPIPSKLQVVTFFAHHAAGKIRTHDISLTCNLLYHCTTQSLVSILHFFPTYYTKPRVYCLFEALNEFKFKSCQLQSFIIFRDL